MRRKGSVMGISEKDYQELWNSTLQIIKDSNTYDDAIFNTYIIKIDAVRLINPSINDQYLYKGYGLYNPAPLINTPAASII